MEGRKGGQNGPTTRPAFAKATQVKRDRVKEKETEQRQGILRERRFKQNKQTEELKGIRRKRLKGNKTERQGIRK